MLHITGASSNAKIFNNLLGIPSGPGNWEVLIDARQKASLSPINY